MTLLSPFSPLHAQKLPDDAAIRTILGDRLAGYPRGVLVVGIIDRNGERVIGVGTPDGKEAKIDYGNAMFEIGSVTKTFTGIILAQMVERGEVTLEDSIAASLPEGLTSKTGSGRIVLLDLATHSSGLPRVPDNMNPADPDNPYADYSENDLYIFLATHRPRFSFLRTYDYSNLGMGLLGMILARRAGSDYETMVRERILRPLGMKSTSITLDPDMKARLVPGNTANGIPASNWDMPVLAGAGALRSTPNDLLRYLAATMGLVQTPLLPAMRTATTPIRSAGTREAYSGLAWVITGDSSIVWHTGQTGGYGAFIGFDRKRDVGVVVLSSISTNVGDIGLHLLDTAQPLAPAEKNIIREFPLPEAALDRYVGRYQLSPEFIVEVTRIGNRLYAQATGQERLRIIPVSEQEFIVSGVDARVLFEGNAPGPMSAMVLRQNGNETRGERMK